MICNSCHAEIPDSTRFCPNCGAPVTAVPVQPYYPTQQPETPARRPAQPLVGMICAIVSFFLAFVLYFAFIVNAATNGEGMGAGLILFTVLDAGLAIFSLVFSIIGLRKSIRTGGRKYVAGIVFSAVGISFSAGALLFLFIAVLIGGALSNLRTSSNTYRYRSYSY